MTTPSTGRPSIDAQGMPSGKPALPGDRSRGRIIPLGRWAGIPVGAQWTVGLTLSLFTEVLAASVLPVARVGLPAWQYWLAGLVTAAAFLATLLLHELAHAVTARRHGVEVRGITLWMLGGVTELEGDAPTPRAEGLIAAAGPATSLGLGAGFGLLAWWAGTSTLLGSALLWLAMISGLLAVFNLLPGSPLDGGRILRAVLWARSGDRVRAGENACRAGRMLGYGIVGLGLLELMAGSFGGLWLALVGWFIIGAANSERAQGAVAGLAGMRAEDVMTPAPEVVADWWTVEQFFADPAPRRAVQAVLPLVDFGGQASGALTLADQERVPLARRDETRLRDIQRARRAQPLLAARTTPLATIAARLRMHGGLAVIIDEVRHPIGTVSALELTRAARFAQDRGRGVVPSTA